MSVHTVDLLLSIMCSKRTFLVMLGKNCQTNKGQTVSKKSGFSPGSSDSIDQHVDQRLWGQYSTMVGAFDLRPRCRAPGSIPSIPQKNSEEKLPMLLKLISGDGYRKGDSRLKMLIKSIWF